MPIVCGEDGFTAGRVFQKPLAAFVGLEMPICLSFSPGPKCMPSLILMPFNAKRLTLRNNFCFDKSWENPERLGGAGGGNGDVRDRLASGQIN